MIYIDPITCFSNELCAQNKFYFVNVNLLTTELQVLICNITDQCFHQLFIELCQTLKLWICLLASRRWQWSSHRVPAWMTPWVFNELISVQKNELKTVTLVLSISFKRCYYFSILLWSSIQGIVLFTAFKSNQQARGRITTTNPEVKKII